VFITDPDHYQTFPKAEHLVVMTSTYGEGDPPSNSTKFASLLAQHPQTQRIRFSVLGFGSRNYAHYCQFGYEADRLLRQQAWAIPVMDAMTVNDNSPQDFSNWLTAWTAETGFALAMPRELLTAETSGRLTLKVVHRTDPDTDKVFVLRLKPRKAGKIESGDLLAIYPKNDHRERLYSIGKIEDEVQLSVKLHEQGLGSGFLNNLKTGDTLAARIVRNRHFYFPKKASQVVLISNGTGIAPFLGMIHSNRKRIPCRLYCGFRTRTSFDLYREFLSEAVQSRKLNEYRLALSREDGDRYVYHLLSEDHSFLWKVLSGGSVVLICGSLSMQNDVLAVLETVCRENDGADISVYRNNGQILTDCY